MKRWIALLLAAIMGVSGGVAWSLLFQMVQVTDAGMMPALEPGDWTLVRSNGIVAPAVERGDVVLLANSVYAVTGEDGWMMKRVVACGGDRIRITGGNVYLNGKPAQEPYVFAEGVSGEMAEVRVPEGYLFVLGDNRAASTDSRSPAVGLVQETAVVGKVVRRLCVRARTP